jgi:membrane protease YdiL (CAAX protease family)
MMKIISEDKKEQRLAKIPHEVFTVNAAIIHLFLTTAMLKFGDPRFAITLPIVISMVIIIWTYFRTKKSIKNDSLLVKIHWQLSLNRYKPLIVTYIFYFLVNGITMVVFADSVKGMDGQNVMQDVFLILAIVPLFITVFLSVLLGSGSMFNAGKGEVPPKLLAKFS